jgi:hydrogenase assembly chaperone HypC/HupF
MCLTTPLRIIKINQDQALAEDSNGKERTIIISAVDGVKEGGWVLVNANLAIQKVSAKEAKQLVNLLKDQL